MISCPDVWGRVQAVGIRFQRVLTVPNFIYRHMVSESGKPNRKFRSYYQSRFKSPKYKAKFHTVALLDAGSSATCSNEPGEMDDKSRALQLVNEIRPRLPKKYRSSPEEDLLVEDLFVVARKMTTVKRN